jgi:hypothetical protein
VMLVTLAEATPVNELIETAFALEDRVGIRLGPVLINRVDLPEQGLMEVDLSALMAQIPQDRRDEVQGVWAAAGFRQVRAREQQRQIHRLAAELPLPQILLAQAPTAEVTAHEIAEAAAPISAWLAESFLLRRTGSDGGSGGVTDRSGE